MQNAFASVNYNRYIGGKFVHIDADWYNNKGDWTEAIASDDFKKTNDYLKKSDMTMKVWSPFWHADYGSEVVNTHPDWLVEGDSVSFYGLHLNLANTLLERKLLGANANRILLESERRRVVQPEARGSRSVQCNRLSWLGCRCDSTCVPNQCEEIDCRQYGQFRC